MNENLVNILSKEKLFPIFSLKNARCFSEQTIFGSITVSSVSVPLFTAVFLSAVGFSTLPVSRKYAILSVSSALLPDVGNPFSLQKSASSRFR